MFSRYLSLSKQIFYALAFMLMLGLIVFSGITFYHIQKENRSQSTKLLYKDIRSVSRELALAFRDQDQISNILSRELIDKLNSTAVAFDIGLDIYSLSGAHLYKANNDYPAVYHNVLNIDQSPNTGLSPSLLQSIKVNNNSYLAPASEVDSTIFYSFYTTLYNSDNTELGVARILYPQSNSINHQSLSTLKTRLNYTLVTLIVIAFIVGWLISRSITRPISRLERTLKNTHSIDQAQPIEWTSSPDLQAFIQSYNQMLLSIRASSDTKVESQKELAWKEMAKIVAHEIKNPLTPMRLSVQSYLMNFDPASPDAQKRAEQLSAVLIEQIDTLSAIASSFSDFSSGKNTANDNNCDLVRVIPLGLGIFTNKYISYHCSCENAVVGLNKTSAIQIISNLIKNALEASHSSDNPIIVELSCDDQTATLSVSDNGCGIDPQTIESIFKPSFTSKSSGMGMGLAIVKGLVEAASGEIECHSENGRGSEFVIRLPLI